MKAPLRISPGETTFDKTALIGKVRYSRLHIFPVLAFPMGVFGECLSPQSGKMDAHQETTALSAALNGCLRVRLNSSDSTHCYPQFFSAGHALTATIEPSKNLDQG